MNCREFRRKLMIEPRSRDKDLANHAESCPECADEAQQALHFEDRLHEALDVRSPGGLESRIIGARSRASDRNLPGLHSRRLALAAGILLAVGIAGWLGLNWNHRFQVNHGLQTAVISHIQDELDHLHADHNIKPGAVAYLLSQFGAAVKGDVGRVNFISRCDIRRQSGVHMVVPGRQGPVTVLIMPGEHRMEREQIRSSRYTGVIIPTDYGSMAVVGERLEPVEQIAEKMQQTIVWDA